MKSWVELACWVSTEEPLTLGDVDRLTETLLVYLEAIGGVPRIDHYVSHDTVCITASANPGTPNGRLVDKLYTRSSILRALDAAGMEVPKEDQLSPGTADVMLSAHFRADGISPEFPVAQPNPGVVTYLAVQDNHLMLQ